MTAGANLDMPCGRARRILWPGDALRVATADVVAARAHEESCAECQAFFHEMDLIRSLTRAAVDADERAAPQAVRERLFAALARTRTGAEARGKRWNALSLTAAAAIVVAVLGLAVIRPLLDAERDVSVLAALADDHARVVSGGGIQSADPEQVSRWLAERVPFPVHVPSFDDATLTGARLYVRGGYRGAVMEYVAGERNISYFVVPLHGNDRGLLSAPLPSPANAADTEFHHALQGGYTVVIWREPGLLHAWIGNVGTSTLERLARNCIQQARASMHAARGEWYGESR